MEWISTWKLLRSGKVAAICSQQVFEASWAPALLKAAQWTRRSSTYVLATSFEIQKGISQTGQRSHRKVKYCPAQRFNVKTLGRDGSRAKEKPTAIVPQGHAIKKRFSFLNGYDRLDFWKIATKKASALDDDLGITASTKRVLSKIIADVHAVELGS